MHTHIQSGVAGALTNVDGNELAARHQQQHKHKHHHIAPDRVFGQRSRRDEAGTMKACLQGDGQHDGEAERWRAQQQEQAERRLASAAALRCGMRLCGR